MRNIPLLAASILVLGVSWAIAQNLKTPPISVNETSKVISASPKQRVEVGLVRWGRDLTEAQKESAESGKPILLLFQEVPG